MTRRANRSGRGILAWSGRGGSAGVSWHVSCSTALQMFLKEALLRCSNLEEEMASVYAALASCPAATNQSAAAWSAASGREKRNARLLHALAELSEALGDDGPFLVQVPLQLSTLRRLVDAARGRVTNDIDAATAERCAEMLDTAPCRELYSGLLEVAEPEIRRVLKLIDEQTRSVRRSGQRSRHPADRRVRGACVSPVG